MISFMVSCNKFQTLRKNGTSSDLLFLPLSNLNHFKHDRIGI